MCDALAVGCVMSLGVALATLVAIGPAPRFGIAAMWVRSNAGAVSVLVGAVIVALGCAVVAMVVGHRRKTVSVACATALVVGIVTFGAELRIILRVLVNYRM